ALPPARCPRSGRRGRCACSPGHGQGATGFPCAATQSAFWPGTPSSIPADGRSSRVGRCSWVSPVRCGGHVSNRRPHAPREEEPHAEREVYGWAQALLICRTSSALGLLAQPLLAVKVAQRLEQRPQVAGDDGVQLVQRQVNAVIGDAIL